MSLQNVAEALSDKVMAHKGNLVVRDGEYTKMNWIRAFVFNSYYDL